MIITLRISGLDKPRAIGGGGSARGSTSRRCHYNGANEVAGEYIISLLCTSHHLSRVTDFAQKIVPPGYVTSSF
jgi:hypothetical protein